MTSSGRETPRPRDLMAELKESLGLPAGRETTADELRALADQIESRECTGVVAVWCPVHGDCRGCTRRDDGEWVEFHPACPLHSDRTAHAPPGARS